MLWMYFELTKKFSFMIQYDLCHLEEYKAVYSQTTRGKEQLIFCGQPFIYEKSVRMPNGQMKKFWRCNQWCDSLLFPRLNSHSMCEFPIMIFLFSFGFSSGQTGGIKSVDHACLHLVMLLQYSIVSTHTKMLSTAKRGWQKSEAMRTKTFRILIICWRQLIKRRHPKMKMEPFFASPTRRTINKCTFMIND